jgi:hypothetical protein
MPDVVYVADETARENLRIVKESLGEGCMSFYTRKVVDGIEKKLDTGKHIEPVELRELMHYYAKDCEFKERGAFPCQRQEAAQAG